MIKKEHVLCTVALVSAVALLFALPWLGFVTRALPLLVLPVVAIIYASMLYFGWQLLVPAGMLLGARFNGSLVVAGLCLVNLGLPFALLLTAHWLVGIVVWSWLYLFAMVIATLMVHGVLCWLVDPYCRHLEAHERLRNCNLTYHNDIVYTMAVHGDKLVPSEPFVIAPARLADVHAQVVLSLRAEDLGNFEKADERLLAAIPEIGKIGFTGNMRLQMAFCILKQSYGVIGDEEGVKECAAQLMTLRDEQRSIMEQLISMSRRTT